MAIHEWQGHTIEIQLVLWPRLLWLGGDFVVIVDGTNRFANGSRGSFNAPTQFTIGQQRGVVRTNSMISDAYLQIGYSVEVDGLLVADGKIRPANWHLNLLCWILLGVVFFGAIAFLVVFVLSSFGS